LRAQVSVPGAANGTCNALVPNNSVYQRFLWVIKQIVDNGMYVLIDNHTNLDNTVRA
jgi:hypothetical protein